MKDKEHTGAKQINILTWLAAGFLICIWVSIVFLGQQYDIVLLFKVHIVALVTFSINYDIQFSLKHFNAGADDKIGCKY